MHNNKHVLHYISPDRHMYSLGPRRHELMLVTKRESRNFLKDLFKNMY